MSKLIQNFDLRMWKEDSGVLLAALCTFKIFERIILLSSINKFSYSCNLK